jgi:hypothetical protein
MAVPLQENNWITRPLQNFADELTLTTNIFVHVLVKKQLLGGLLVASGIVHRTFIDI